MNQELVLQFRSLELSDKKVIDDFLRRYPTRRLNYCFEVLYLWSDACQFRIGFYGDFMLVKTFIDCHHNFLYPLGEGDVCEVVSKMILFSESRGCPFRLFQLSKADKEVLEECLPERFNYEIERGESEYIYSSEKLATLAGRKMQHKRNHVNYFEQHYDWNFEPITLSNLEECREFNQAWFEDRRQAGDFGETIRAELSAIKRAFVDWEALGLDGAILRADGNIVAYSVGCPLAGDTYLVLFEKSLHHIRGASQQINRLFVKEYATNYKYVNRGEDSGDEGLRHAKLSYHPDLLEDVYSIRFKNSNGGCGE